MAPSDIITRRYQAWQAYVHTVIPHLCESSKRRPETHPVWGRWYKAPHKHNNNQAK